MSHFMRAQDRTGFRLDRPRAAVRVKVVKQRPVPVLQVDYGDGTEPPICLLNPDAELALLPERAVVLDQAGNPIPPTGRFAVTLETIDPYHLLVDLF